MAEIIIEDNIKLCLFTIEVVSINNEPVIGLIADDFVVKAGEKIGKEISPGVFEIIFD